MELSDTSEHWFPTAFPASSTVSSRVKAASSIVSPARVSDICVLLGDDNKNHNRNDNNNNVDDNWDPFAHPHDEIQSRSSQPVDLDAEEEVEEEQEETRTIVSVATDPLPEDPLAGIDGAAQAVQETNTFIDLVVQQRQRERNQRWQQEINRLQRERLPPSLAGLMISVHDDLDTVREKYLQQLYIINDLQVQMEMAQAKETEQKQQIQVIQSYVNLQQSTIKEMQQRQQEKTFFCGCPIEQRLAMGDAMEHFKTLGANLRSKHGYNKMSGDDEQEGMTDDQLEDDKSQDKSEAKKSTTTNCTGSSLSCGLLFGNTTTTTTDHETKTSAGASPPLSTIFFLPLWSSPPKSSNMSHVSN